MKHVLELTGYEMVTKDIERAEGYYVYDSSGKKYIDFESGVWSTNLGHNNAQVNEAIKKQIDIITHFGFKYSGRIVDAAALKVLETLNIAGGKCVFLCSGSEAVELSIKIAKALIKNKKILTFKESYLSAYGSSGNKNDSEWFKFELSKCMKCTHRNECKHCMEFNSIPFEEIGVFAFEPGNSSGLVLIPPKGLISEISKRIKDNKGIIVVDEVTTGIGRTGKWYGFQHFDIKPDIVALGKGMGNGYPVSAVAVEKEIADILESKIVRHSQSHQNDALGCAAVSEVIRFIEDNNLTKTAEETGGYFIEKLKGLKEKTNLIKEVRGRGLMIAVEFEDELKETMELIKDHLMEKGFLFGYIPAYNLIRFYPSLTILREDIDSLVEGISECIL